MNGSGRITKANDGRAIQLVIGRVLCGALVWLLIAPVAPAQQTQAGKTASNRILLWRLTNGIVYINPPGRAVDTDQFI